MVEQLVLQLVDGGSKPTSPLHYRIDPMPHGEAKTFVETWHYSHRMPTGKNICFGNRRQLLLVAIMPRRRL